MVRRGHFVLHSRFLPDVVAGRYEYVSRVTGTPFPTREERTHVHVVAPRYTMPPEQILSTYPPANGEGAFGQRLPQVVLKRRTLPWERNPAGGTGVSTTPWLALVVLAEGEGEISTATAVADAVTPGTTLLDPTDRDVDQTVRLTVTQTVLDRVFPTRDDLELLVHVREVDVNDTELVGGDDDGWLAVVLANRLPVMDVATGTPVRYTACLVNLEGQLASLPPEQPERDTFEFERVQDWRVFHDQPLSVDQHVSGTGAFQQLAVRLAEQGLPVRAEAAQALLAARVAGPTPSVAALDGASATSAAPRSAQWRTAVAGVSAAALQPEAQLRVRDAMKVGWNVPISVIAAERTYRFPVLAHWSFTTTEGATFEYLMQNLDHGLLGTLEGEHLPRDPEPVSVGAPAPPPRPVTTRVLETGHLELGHRTRRGDRTAAWYRGPLVPHPTRRDEPVDGRLPLAHSADQLRRTVPDGRDDLTYAAAFEIGRLLALSQLSVVSALLRFRGEQFGRERVRQLVDAHVPFDGLLTVRDAALARLVHVRLVGSLATATDATLGPARPVVDPGRPLHVRGDLDQLVASGLGLDLAAVRKLAGSVGLEAALQAARVPVGRQEGGDDTDELTLRRLEGALEARLAQGLLTALGKDRSPLRTAPPGARGTTRSAAGRPVADALDDLIGAAPADDETGE
jgi:hypothetical protein